MTDKTLIFQPGTRVRHTDGTRGIVLTPPDSRSYVKIRPDDGLHWLRVPTHRLTVLMQDAHLEDCRSCDGTGIGAHHGNCPPCAGTSKRPTCDHCGEQDGITLRHTGRCDCTAVPIPEPIMRDVKRLRIWAGDRVEYVGKVAPNFRGTHGTVLGPEMMRRRAPTGCVNVMWDTGDPATPDFRSIKLIKPAIPKPMPVLGSCAPIIERTEGEKRAYLSGFRAGGDQMERSFRDKLGTDLGLLDPQVQARLQFNRIAEAVERTIEDTA